MANFEYDFAPGKFALFEVGPDGPSRLEGHMTYENLATAERAAERLLRSGGSRRITIFEVGFTYRLDPHPELLTNKHKTSSAGTPRPPKGK